MAIERGRVIQAEPGWVEIEMVKSGGCQSCSQQGCGVGVLNRALARNRFTLRLPAAEHYQVGDEVSVSLPQSSLLLTALLVYGAPLLGFLLGIFVIATLWPQQPELLQLLGGVLLGIGGFSAARAIACRWVVSRYMQPQISGRCIDSCSADMLRDDRHSERS